MLRVGMVIKALTPISLGRKHHVEDQLTSVPTKMIDKTDKPIFG